MSPITSIGVGETSHSKTLSRAACDAVSAMRVSQWLKNLLLLDIVLLAFFYTFRVLAGGEAARVPVSFWLTAFSMFFFLSLASVKRFMELRLLLDQERPEAQRRSYRPVDLIMLSTWGA